MRTHCRYAIALSVAVIAACSSPNTATEPNGILPANPTQTATTTDGGSDAGTSPETQAGAIPIALDSALDTTKKYRLAVVWLQPNDDGPDPAPQVAYDVPFAPNQVSIAIPALAVPRDTLILCARDGNDESVSPCRSDSPFNLGVALLVIGEDANGDGAFTFDEPRALLSLASFIYSAKGGDVLPRASSGEPALIDGTIRSGTHLYESYKRDGGFDRLRPYVPGTTVHFTKSGPNLG
jgi:hypothetical protein